jgi:hypothetical protein
MRYTRLVRLAMSVFFLAALFAIRPPAPPAHGQAFPDAHDPPIPGWSGPVFKLRQDYPATLPAPESYPWKALDPATQPIEYVRSVLAYAYEGNLAVDWQVENNPVRGWYHAPWMHSHDAGREFVHGLTRERDSRAGELHANQATRFQNWAVSVYNPPGGHVIGQVWSDPNAPDPTKAAFADGAVAVKLLFTEATVAEVPYLRDSHEWQAHIHQALNSTTRTIRTLRLLQIDVAVRDTRLDGTTGWAFGTFVYDADAPGTTPWERMVPVGLQWGNDPGVTPAMVAAGTALQETAINPAVLPLNLKLGWAGRLNGPVDNPASSCLSCHSTAQVPQGAMIPPSTAGDQARLRWFRNIKAGEPFDPGRQSTDYSLQISVAIRFFNEAQAAPDASPGARAVPSGDPDSASFVIPREGEEDPADPTR